MLTSVASKIWLVKWLFNVVNLLDKRYWGTLIGIKYFFFADSSFTCIGVMDVYKNRFALVQDVIRDW